MSEKTLREAAVTLRDMAIAWKAGDRVPHGVYMRAIAEFHELRGGRFANNIKETTGILAALDAEAEKADASGYDRGRREALEEVRAWLEGLGDGRGWIYGSTARTVARALSDHFLAGKEPDHD